MPNETPNLPDVWDANAPAPAQPADVAWEREALGPPAENGVDWRRYVHAILRYRWLILLVTALGTGAGVVMARFVPVEYVAQATLWIEVSGRNEANQGPIRSAELLDSSAWVALLRSYTVLDEVVRELRLYLKPASPADSTVLATFRLRDRFQPGSYRLEVDAAGERFTLATVEGAVLERGRVGEAVGAELGFQWTPPASELTPERVIAFAVTTPRAAAQQLNAALITSMDGEGNFLELRLRNSDPQRAAATVNALAQRQVEVAADLKRSKLDELTKILDEQLQYAENNLRQAEMDLEGFRVQTITLPAERATPVTPGLEYTQDPVFANYFSMQIEREQLRRDRDAIQRALADASSGGWSTDAIDVIPAVQNSSELRSALDALTAARAELRALRRDYTEQHPLVRQGTADVERLQTETLPRLASQLAQELDTRAQALGQLIGSASQELEQIPPRAIEEARLTRRVAIAENLYTMLQGRYEEARLAAVSSIPDVRILDEAVVPERPAGSDQRPLIILMAMGGSLGLAVLGAILRDRTDRRLRYPLQVTHDLGLPILGAVPHVERKNARRDDDALQALEAFREIRLSVSHAYGAAGPLVLAITSPGAGDGKSFVSSNLALGLAELGRRTLLIDGDIRRGDLHRLLDCPRKPGLTDYLLGNARPDEIIQSTAYPSLSLIASGTRIQEGPELLGSSAMAQLLNGLRPNYDAILVDTAPLGAGVDPFVLGTLTGNLLLVLRTGATDREMALAKLELLDRLPIRILGAILNDVPSRGAYQRYYHYSYLSGYEAHDEVVEEPPRQLESV